MVMGDMPGPRAASWSGARGRPEGEEAAGRGEAGPVCSHPQARLCRNLRYSLDHLKVHKYKCHRFGKLLVEL
jgi:hypothetical protein